MKYAIFLCLTLLLSLGVNAQEIPQSDQQVDTEVNPADSVGTQAVNPPKGDIETTIEYISTDSMFLDAINQMMYLYGNAKVDYGATSLEADQIVIDYKNNTLQANGRVDSLGKQIGFPVFSQDGQTFQTEDINYNFKTDRAKIKGVVTQEGEAYMHGENVMKNEDNALFIKNAKYTTCNLKEPHFHIQATKMKMIKDDRMITGPFNLYVNDVPTPLGFAFGMFPAPRQRVSGLIFPEFGEEKRRGFFLRDGGYYLKVNDYITAELLGSIYSKGTYGLSLKTDYRKRYSYNGNFSFRYNRNAPQDEISDLVVKDYWVNWSHSPQTRGTGRFSANVSAGTSTFNTNNAETYGDMVKANFNSSISYSKTFQGTPFSLAANLRHSQNVTKKTVNLTLPEISFTMNRIYPFRSKNSTGKTWYEKIGVDYRMNMRNDITNSERQFSPGFDIANLDTASFEQIPFEWDYADELFSRMENDISHKTSMNTSIKLFKHFTLSPSLNYEEKWYNKELQYNYIDSLEAVRIDTVSTFSRAGTWSANASLGTQIYGTFIFGDKSPVKAIRHAIIPSISIGYRPENTGSMTEVQVNDNGDIQQMSKYSLARATTSQESGNIGFGITNNLEMKVRDKDDTTGTGYKKVKLLDNFSIRSSYDLVKDSFNLSQINLNARTALFDNKIRLDMSANIDPYTYVLESQTINETTGETVVEDRRINEFAWDNGQGLGTIRYVQMGITTSLTPETFSGNNNKKADEKGLDEEEVSMINADPDMYVSWDIPWRLNINYRMTYNRPSRFQESNINHNLNFSGDLNVTEKWKIGFRSGYDFKNNGFTQTQLNIYRDLHCWDLRFDWVPFGNFQSFSLNLAVKASVLQDLKLSRRRSWRDN